MPHPDFERTDRARITPADRAPGSSGALLDLFHVSRHDPDIGAPAGSDSP